MFRKIEGDARGKSDIEETEFQCINVGEKVHKYGEAFVDVANIVSKARRDS